MTGSVRIETRRIAPGRLEVMLERETRGVAGSGPKCHRELLELEGDAADKFERALERVVHSG